MADLERLTVLIEANTRQITRQLKTLERDIDKSMRTSARSVNTLNKSLATAARTAKGFVAAFVVRELARIPGYIGAIIDELSDIKDTADAVGLTTDRLQQLQYQAEQTGASVEGLATGLETLAKRGSEARRGKGELADLFGANFIDPNKLKTTSQLLDTIIDLIGRGADEAARLDIASQAFGRAFGPEAALMFVGGAKAAEEYAENLDDIYTPEQLAAAKRYDDALKRIQRTLEVRIKGGFITDIENIGKTFQRAFSGGGQYITGGDRAVVEAGDRIAGAFADGFENNKELEAALQKKLSIAGGEDYTILPPDPEQISEATGQLREMLQLRYEHIKIVTDEQQRIADLIAEMERERSLIGATDEEIAKSNALREAGAYATGEQREQIAALAVTMVQEQAALDELIDRMDTLRDAAGSAMDSFVQSLADAKGPMEALKAGLVDILQSIIRIAEQQAIAKLFGAAGTAGTGILGGILGAAPGIGSVAPAKAAASQAMAVHITAEPSPLLNLTITKSSQAAEERAIARGPVVARSNNMRYAIP